MMQNGQDGIEAMDQMCHMDDTKMSDAVSGDKFVELQSV